MLKITPIQTGEVQIKSRHVEARFSARRARVADVLGDHRWSRRLPIFCFAIDHPDGLIVVDTGESSHANVVFVPSHDPESPRRLAESPNRTGSSDRRGALT